MLACDCGSRTYFIINFFFRSLKTFLGKSRKAGKLLFETQMTAIKLGWDSHSRGIYFFSFFS